MKKDLILVGADVEIIELIQRINNFNILGVIDNYRSGDYFDIPIIGRDDDIELLRKSYKHAEVTITLDDTNLKEKLYWLYKNADFHFAKLISPDAYVSKFTKIDEGVIIQRGVNIGPSVEIGICSKINVYANIMHDGIIGKFCTIAPNAVTLGYVQIGDNVFIGAHSTLLPHVVIGNKSVVGAGAVVTKNVPDNTIVKGVPAR